MAIARLYCMVVTHLCSAGGEPERFRVPAISWKQAAAVTRILFNRKHRRKEETFVRMRLDRVEPLPSPPVVAQKRGDATPYLPGCAP